ncbi:MAG: hypothetical protein ABIC82_02260 [bacterium]
MNTIEVKIEKICKKLEKDFHAQVVRGKSYKTKENTTIPVSIKKIDLKNQTNSPYSLPIGLIQINGNRVKFISIEQKHLFIKMIIKLVLVFFGILGIRGLFKSKKRWDSE